MTSARTALFPSAFAPHLGGVEELTRQIAVEQRRRGRTPTVVTMLEPKSLPMIDDVDGIDVLRFRFRVPEPSFRFLAGWAVHSRSTHSAVQAALRERNSDLIHVQCVSNNARYALAAARKLELGLVVSLQGELTMDASGIYQRSAQMRRSWRRLVDAANVITGCSRFVVDEAERFAGTSFDSRAVVVHNGINLAECERAQPVGRGRPYVLGLGRLVKQKGYDLLIDAFSQLSSQFPEHELVIAGDGPERQRLMARAAARSLEGRVSFLGAVDRVEALSLFAGADAFVLASRHEPQGIVVLEAMATGTVVVAASVGGVPEIVSDGVNGYLFRGGDVSDLRNQLEGALSSPRAELVASARATAANHDWPLLVDRYDDCYRTAMGTG